MTQANANEGRRYAGLAPDERVRQRRAVILEAATDLFAGSGYRNTSVKQICDKAGLTQRYFYESFPDREAALLATYDELAAQMRAETLAAIEAAPDPDDLDVVIERGLSAFVGFLTTDTRRAQIVLIEVVGVSPQLETRRHTVLHDFADLVTGVWLGHSEPTSQQRLTAVALVGGVNHVLVDWLLDGTTRQPAELVQACVTLFTGARHRLTPPTE
ncbi:TetR family transcriptional regulator [Allosaccharopolyspora coralli]|uniref:TetR family transcriptional regulator n=1 Tax=Allosaccharopolyspora coralli TaxID=2665642 RepID=A0A5Q3QGN9_9PSEU|nr:TetR/AcrR family transcriptional regulator [Allosaccharopolyspora coralli]QGK69977.1 TetR family transcriptional regulator [Allosaccharopolyspora coralli]